MMYGVDHAEYVVDLAYSAEGHLKGDTRSCVIIFKDIVTGEEIDLGEQKSKALYDILKILKEDKFHRSN